MSNYYYATCAFGWSRALTWDDAVKNLVRRFDSDIKRCITNAQKEGNQGFYLWTCRVQGEVDAPISINYYCPQDVEYDEATEWSITKVTAKLIDVAPAADVRRIDR